ncbi:MAG: A/G-specific adenine glycosylase [Proteobacteria bacterium]|nr:A/G-specific adenine glycosylase [Pseudomonadota bacterium]
MLNPKNFQTAILKWFDKQGRKDLPWQKNRTAYHVWLSEIMLQQTQVTTVIAYFERFIKKFPTIQSLALADINEVLHLWTGLGYYARARNLHKTAQMVVEKYQGKFPKDILLLQELPGIGRSTAGAILAQAYQLPEPILDGNVKRVLTRFHAIREDVTKAPTLKKLWDIAIEYTPQIRVTDYTQAIMDLGALICTRTKPQCSQCPLHTHCQAYALNQQTEYPKKNIRKLKPIRQTQFLLIRNTKKEFLLEQKPPSGIWGGLWIFPECPDDKNISDWCKTQYGFTLKKIKKQNPFRHTFTHFHLDITPVLAEIDSPSRKIMDSSPVIWYKQANNQALGLAAPVKKLLEEFAE